jgi:tetratricopeptide (TPR) repeat protein
MSEEQARMTRRHQLKNEARRAEQRSDWARAIELYKTAIRLEDEDESGPDVGVYNRVGDLYLKQGNTAAAIEYYEQAVDHYRSHGLHTSAIALCNKILRIAPDRDEVYGRLARLHASTGLLAEAKSAFLRFAARMRETNRLSEALEAVQDLVSLTGDEEIRTAFAEQLAGADLKAQAVAQLRLVYEARVAGGRNAQDIREKILALDPEADPAGSAAAPPPRATPTPEPPASDLQLSDLGPADPIAHPVVTEATEVLAGGADLPDDEAEGDVGVESVLTKFRSQVREIVEETDHAVHYDLGVAYKGMGLLDDAIGEFRLAMQSPALMESAHALLGECIRSRGGTEDSDALGQALEEDYEPGLPLSTTDDFMMGQTLDLGVSTTPDLADSEVDETIVDGGLDTPEKSTPVDDPVSDPLADVAPDTSVRAEEDDLADMLFQARLAQHRARAAAEAGQVDHQAHLALGQTYWRMGLLTEAVRDLVMALDGPAGVETEALDTLERIAFSEAIDADVLREALTCLMGRDRHDAAVTAGRDFLQRPGIREVDRQAVLTLLPPEEPSQAAERPPESQPHPKEAVAELRDIYAELDAVAGDELDPAAYESPRDAGPAADSTGKPVGVPSGAPESEPSPAGDDPAAVFGEAEGLRAAGRMDEAASHYYRALEMFEKKRDAINAIRAVDRLLGLRPDDVVLHHQRTEFAIMTNDRDLLVSSYLDLAACLRRQNGYRSARTVYGRIFDLDPHNAEARAGIAAVDADELARERRRQQQPDERASGGSTSVPARESGEEADRPRGELDEMFLDLREDAGEVNEYAPDYESHYELGIAFRQMEMWDEAAREFKLAVQGMADPLPAYEHLGESLLALRRYDEARRTLGVAATQPGQDQEKVGVLFYLGVAHLRAGDRASARTCLESVLQIDPSRADAAQLLSTLPA